jgi:hypothetical protein
VRILAQPPTAADGGTAVLLGSVAQSEVGDGFAPAAERERSASTLGCLSNQRAVNLEKFLLMVGAADGGMSPDKETDHEYYA